MATEFAVGELVKPIIIIFAENTEWVYLAYFGTLLLSLPLYTAISSEYKWFRDRVNILLFGFLLSLLPALIIFVGAQIYVVKLPPPEQVIVIQTVVHTATPSIPTETPTITPTVDPIELEREAIREIIRKLIDDWSKENFPDGWDAHITDNYRKRYLEDVYRRLDQMEYDFSQSNRRIVGPITVQLRENRTKATATMQINYGNANPPESCEFWFELIKIVDAGTEAGVWFVDNDKTLVVEGLQLCPP